MKRILRTGLGILLVVVGVVALVTPFTPGSWLAFFGLEILGVRVLLQKRLVAVLPRRYGEKVEAWLSRLMQKIPGRWLKSDSDDPSRTSDPSPPAGES